MKVEQAYLSSSFIFNVAYLVITIADANTVTAHRKNGGLFTHPTSSRASTCDLAVQVSVKMDFTLPSSIKVVWY